MIRAGLLGAGVSVIYVMSLTLISPLCAFCLTPLLGGGAGYLASWFNKPLRLESCMMDGAVAGLLTGIGALAGQMLAALVNAVLVTNSLQLPEMMAQMGFGQFMPADTAEYWRTTLLLNSMCGFVNLALLITLGTVGSVIWFRRHNNNSLSAV